MTRISLGLGRFLVLTTAFAIAASQSNAQSLIGRGPLLLEASESPEPPTASPARAPMLVLRQIVDPMYRRIYFIEAYAKGIVYENPTGRGRDTTSNVVVYGANSYGTSVQSMVETWADHMGHVHSARVLRSQMEFNAMISKRGKYIYPANLTGILDRYTLLIPVMKLEWRHEDMLTRFAGECQQVQGRACDGAPWPNGYLRFWRSKIDEIVPLLVEYKREINRIPLSVPTRSVSTVNWKDFTNGDPDGGGLKGISFAGDQAKGFFLYSPDGAYQDEEEIRESFDPLDLTPEGVKAAGQNATDAVIAAERTGDDL